MNNKTRRQADDGDFTVQALPYEATPFALYERVRRLPLPVLFASGDDRHGKDTRFDYITAAPDKVLRAWGNRVRIGNSRGECRETEGHPVDVLAAEFPIGASAGRPLDIPFTGGAVGFLGYETMHPQMQITPRQQRDIDLPDMLIGIYSWVVAIDHREKRCSLVFRPDCAAETRHAVTDALSSPSAPLSGHFALTGDFVPNFSRIQYQQAYQRVIDYILAGDCYQVNLTQRFTADCRGDPYTAFRGLQTLAKAPFAAFVEDGEQAVLSFSPERFIGVCDCEVMTQPIKGTRPRSSDPDQDARNRVELENSPKDRAENLMIVDLLRNDLGRVCTTGSIAVPALFETRSFTNVHHLVSTVTGRLQRPGDVFDLIKACFPGGSITGTPKIRSMEIINELESVMRSVYCGAFMWVDFNGNMDSNICIRTLVRDRNRMHCWGGGGVVADSVGEQEYQESLAKVSLFMDALKRGC